MWNFITGYCEGAYWFNATCKQKNLRLKLYIKFYVLVYLKCKKQKSNKSMIDILPLNIDVF